MAAASAGGDIFVSASAYTFLDLPSFDRFVGMSVACFGRGESGIIIYTVHSHNNHLVLVRMPASERSTNSGIKKNEINGVMKSYEPNHILVFVALQLSRNYPRLGLLTRTPPRYLIEMDISYRNTTTSHIFLP